MSEKDPGRSAQEAAILSSQDLESCQKLQCPNIAKMGLVNDQLGCKVRLEIQRTMPSGKVIWIQGETLASRQKSITQIVTGRYGNIPPDCPKEYGKKA